MLQPIEERMNIAYKDCIDELPKKMRLFKTYKFRFKDDRKLTISIKNLGAKLTPDYVCRILNMETLKYGAPLYFKSKTKLKEHLKQINAYIN